jgi:hypothetical protein
MEVDACEPERIEKAASDAPLICSDSPVYLTILFK